jgi:hypothetical protein
LEIFAPPLSQSDLADTATWRVLANAVIIGMALPAPLFCLARGRGNSRLGAGGMFALAAGLGVLLLLPPAVIEWLARTTPPRNNHIEAAACLYFVLPPMGLWYLLAALAGGHAGRRLFSRTTPWIERYGFLLAFLWSPLGVWQLVDIYRDALK